MRTEAIGVNYIDVYHRTGLYPLPSPIPLGQEGAGCIEHLGPGVTTMRVGDLVAWSGVAGSYATHVVDMERLELWLEAVAHGWRDVPNLIGKVITD